MKIAVISDIHGNYEAFSIVLDDIRTKKADAVVSLGDNIGYGADSEKVIQLIRHHRIFSVLGNHEAVAGKEEATFRLREDARKALDIAVSSLSEDSLDFIRDLPFHLSLHDCLFVHGFPPDSARVYLYLVGEEELLDAFVSMGESVCFLGHTHELGLIYVRQGRIIREKLQPGRQHLPRGRKYLINAGSVGQTRTGPVRATYVIWDTESYELEVRSLAYDAATAARKIRAAGIPDIYARILTKEM